MSVGHLRHLWFPSQPKLRSLSVPEDSDSEEDEYIKMVCLSLHTAIDACLLKLFVQYVLICFMVL